MILVDTSVWVDFLRHEDQVLEALLDDQRVLTHPFVIGEIAMGNLRNREAELTFLCDLPEVAIASHQEVMELIEQNRLFELGIGYVDAHLLAAARLANAVLWTRDRRLANAAARLSIVVRIPH